MVILLAERHPRKYEKTNALSCCQIITERTNFLLPVYPERLLQGERSDSVSSGRRALFPCPNPTASPPLPPAWRGPGPLSSLRTVGRTAAISSSSTMRFVEITFLRIQVTLTVCLDKFINLSRLSEQFPTLSLVIY